MHTTSTNYSNAFDPQRLGGIRFWVDASDPSTVTTSGGIVTSVRDKSSNRYVLSNGAGFTYPNNTFNGTYPSFYSAITTTSRLIGSNPSVVMPPSPVTIFWVGQGIPGGATNTSSNTLLSYMWGEVQTGNRIARIGSNGNWNIGGSVPYTTLGIFTTRVAGTRRDSYVNGSLVFATSGNISTSTGIILGAGLGATSTAPMSNSYSGHLCEMIAMSGVSDSNQIAVEGYLAWKWGLTSLLPSTHMFRYRPPGMVAFEPIHLGTAEIWFDAADVGSYGVSGNDVTIWQSKAGTLNYLSATSNPSIPTFTPAAGALQAGVAPSQNGFNVLRVAQNITTVTEFGFSNQRRMRGFVIRPTVNTTSSTLTFLDQTPLATNVDRIRMTNGVLSEVQEGYLTLVQASNALPNQQNVIGIYVFGVNLSASFNTITVRYNGSTLPALTNLASTNFTTGNRTLVIGSNIDIAEWVSIGTEASLEYAEQLEGYFAWKWGLVSLLPATHAFSKFPPMSPTFNPPFLVFTTALAWNAVRRAFLWLDAADSNVFTGSDPWIDKSLAGNNAINSIAGVTTMPTVTNWNGLRAARFVAGNKNSMKTTSNAPTVAMLFIVARVQAVGAGFVMNYATDGSRRIEVPSGGFPLAITARANTNVASNVTAVTVNQGEGFLITTYSSPLTVFGNGGWVGTTGVSAATLSQIFFGSAITDSGYATIDIGEIIGYDFRILPGQQALVEGYLAWKWGLVGSLPVSHPYKYVKP